MTSALAVKVFACASTLEEAEDLFGLFERAKTDAYTQFQLSAAYERRKDQLTSQGARNAQVRAYPRFSVSENPLSRWARCGRGDAGGTPDGECGAGHASQAGHRKAGASDLEGTG